MRFLLFNNHCITDPTAGVVQSLWTIARWLVQAGHECRVLTTARFESQVTFTIDTHLTGLGVRLHRRDPRQGKGKGGSASRKPIVRFTLDGVPVHVLMTRHNDETQPDRAEARQYLQMLQSMFDEAPPDVAIVCNGHPMVLQGMELARSRSIVSVFAVRGYGYDDRRFFEHVDHVFTCSRFLTDFYRARIGLASTALEPPIDWSKTAAPKESRSLVTFVNPAPHKGSLLFARLADMLGSRRPDIPMMVVQSGGSAAALNQLSEFDFTRHPQIMAAPPVGTPGQFFALTKILLVPSVWPEPFGRVAAEAMLNGIPAIVSDRGSLPEVVGGDYDSGGGGRVVPLPAWMEPTSQRVPSEDDVQPWFEAVCQLWDDADFYKAVSQRARQLAAERYGEAVSRRRHLDYLTTRKPGGMLFDEQVETCLPSE